MLAFQARVAAFEASSESFCPGQVPDSDWDPPRTSVADTILFDEAAVAAKEVQKNAELRSARCKLADQSAHAALDLYGKSTCRVQRKVVHLENMRKLLETTPSASIADSIEH